MSTTPRSLGGLKGNLPSADWKYDGVVTYSNSDANYMFDQCG